MEFLGNTDRRDDVVCLVAVNPAAALTADNRYQRVQPEVRFYVNRRIRFRFFQLIGVNLGVEQRFPQHSAGPHAGHRHFLVRPITALRVLAQRHFHDLGARNHHVLNGGSLFQFK